MRRSTWPREGGVGGRRRWYWASLGLGVVIVGALAGKTDAATALRIATFNVENYLEMDRRIEGRFRPAYPKPEGEKAAIRTVIRAVGADVIALQEIGPAGYLEELRRDLREEGCDYPFGYVLEAADPERHVAVLARIPLARVTPHRDLKFNYRGGVETVKRGLLEVAFGSPDAEWSLFVVHLKSRHTEHPDDPAAAEWRVLEARAVRDAILDRFPRPEGARFVIAGDFNDTARSRALRAVQQRGTRRIALPVPAADSRGETWTHRFLAEGLYSRVDFLLVSPALWPLVAGGEGHVHDGAGALAGSDHRAVYLDLLERSLEDWPAPVTEAEENPVIE